MTRTISKDSLPRQILIETDSIPKPCRGRFRIGLLMHNEKEAGQWYREVTDRRHKN